LPPGSQGPEFDAVILAGGRAARMRGADKPALEVGGVPMLVSVAGAAAEAGASRLVVVGPQRGGAVSAGLASVSGGLARGLVTVSESPPAAGPVPALICGLTHVSAPWVALLAADLPFLTAAWLRELLELAESAAAAGAVLTDAGGRPQWLAGCWRAAALGPALAGYPGDSLGALLRPLEPARLRPRDSHQPPWLDCDDTSELAAARAAYQDGDP
jgi:molybdopterin-guanine dinucleotide biosynthesis protein A